MTKERWVDFRELKEKVSFEVVLDRYEILERMKRVPGGLRGPCPIHQGNHPKQFAVSTSKRAYYCFGRCRSGGTVLDFVARMEGVSLRAAALLLANWFDLGSPGRQTRPARTGRSQYRPPH